MTTFFRVLAGRLGVHRVLVALPVVACLAVSCGGEAEGGKQPSPSSTAGASGTGGGGGGAPRGTALGNCVLGFDPNDDSSRPCAWVGDALCYDTKAAACACICPRDRNDSVCLSGFDEGPDGHVPVNCF